MNISGLAQGLSAGLAGGVQGYRMAEQDNAAKVERERRMAREDSNASFQDEQRTRQRADWSQADKIKAAIEGANGAARTEYETLLNPPTLAGNGGAAQQVGTTGADTGLTAPAPKPAVSREEATVLALKARTGHLLKALGPGQEWAEAWKQEAGARDALRAQSMDQGYAQYKQTGDPSVLIKATYPWVDDGWDLRSAETVQGADGQQVVRAIRVNKDTGQTEEKVLTVDQALKGFDALRDPANARKVEVAALAAQQAAGREQANKVELERVKGDEQRKTFGVRGETQENVAEIRAEAQIEAKKLGISGAIKLSKLRTASGGKSGGNRLPHGGVQSKNVDSMGRVWALMRDGTKLFMTDDDGNPVTDSRVVDQALSATKIVAGSLQGMNNTPDQNADAGSKLKSRISDNVTPKPGLNTPTTNKTPSRADDAAAAILRKAGVIK